MNSEAKKGQLVLRSPNVTRNRELGFEAIQLALQNKLLLDIRLFKPAHKCSARI